MGAFHGTIDKITPTGRRNAKEKEPGLSAGIISPLTWVVMDAASRIIPAASFTLNLTHGIEAPVSPIMLSMKLSARSSSNCAARSKISRR
jgi:hypothetical protein